MLKGAAKTHTENKPIQELVHGLALSLRVGREEESSKNPRNSSEEEAST